eukprot:TRINITY_DN53708_c0_g1_i1.p2 TRINITY_DN53708_c0_g1~~TRINITY_DN53708_c0_g1_i1.p2  ORF type:complete len:175 (-),score=31.26 TRINITY_DN53708_c0_g1_i1:508-1032(-)
MERAHYEVRFVLPEDGSCSIQRTLEEQRGDSAAGALLPRGPAHITFGELDCLAGSEEQALAAVARVCSEKAAAKISVIGRLECFRKRSGPLPFYLPVELSPEAEAVLDAFCSGGLLVRPRQRLHVSVGRYRGDGPLSCAFEDWEGNWTGVTVLKLDGKRSRNFVAARHFDFGTK